MQYIEARCLGENEDVFEAAPTGDAPTILLPIKVRLILEVWRYIPKWMKTRVYGFFDTDPYEVSQAEWVLNSTDREKTRVKEPIKMGFVSIPHLKKQIQPFNPIETVSKVDDSFLTIVMTAHNVLVRSIRSARLDTAWFVNSVTYFDPIG